MVCVGHVVGADVGFEHLRVLGDLFVAALGEHAAMLQHGDPVAQVGNHREVVLDHEDGALGGDLADQLDHPGDVLAWPMPWVGSSSSIIVGSSASVVAISSARLRP